MKINKQQIIDLYEEPVTKHRSYSEIAKIVGCSTVRVWQIVKEAKEKGLLE